MDEIRDKRFLMTGAAGFVGANLVRALLGRGAEVHAVVHPSTDSWRIRELSAGLVVHRADLTDAGMVAPLVSRVCPEYIFHLATRRSSGDASDSRELFRANVLAVANLLEAAQSCDYRRFVYLGSSTEYGSKDSPMKETDILEPVTLYGVAKAAATLLCQQHAHAHQRPVLILRPFLLYGCWDLPTRFIPTAIRAVVTGGDLPLTVPGFRRDYLFVEDLAEACLRALTADIRPGEIINIGSARQAANEEVVEIIQKLAGRRAVVRTGAYPPAASDRPCWVADITRAKRVLGWEPRHSLEEGLARTISWYRRYPGAL